MNEHDILIEALQALKDIIGAADNGQPYDREELEREFLPILGMAYDAGIRLPGEE